MITLKYWNSLSTACRQTIVKIISNGCDNNNEIILPYHHSIDYNVTGRKLKCYLSRVFLTSSGKLKVFTEILPTFASSDETVKKAQRKQVNNSSSELHRYYFRMYTKDDPEDGETIYEDAYDQYQAITMAHDDFHGIVRLDLIRVV